MQDDDVVTIDDDDTPVRASSPRRRSGRGRETFDTEWSPNEKTTIKSTAKKSTGISRELLALTNNDNSSQRKRSGSPTPNPKYQKATRRPSPQRENTTAHRVSNDVVCQMLGVLMARVEKLETDRKKIAPIEEKMKAMAETLTECQNQLVSLSGKVDEGLGSGAILKIIESVDEVKQTLRDSQTIVDRLNGRMEGVEMWKETNDTRLQGLRVKTKSVVDSIKNVEQARERDLDTLETHTQQITILEGSVQELQQSNQSMVYESSLPVTPVASSKAPNTIQPTIATPEQLRQLPVLNSDSNPQEFPGNMVNGPSELQGNVNKDWDINVSDILSEFDSSALSELPLLNEEEPRTLVSQTMGLERNAPSLVVRGNEGIQSGTTNAEKPSAPIKISLFKKPLFKTTKVEEEKKDSVIGIEASIHEKLVKLPEYETMPRPSHEGLDTNTVKPAVQSDPNNNHLAMSLPLGKDLGAGTVDSLAKPKNKFFKSKDKTSNVSSS